MAALGQPGPGWLRGGFVLSGQAPETARDCWKAVGCQALGALLMRGSWRWVEGSVDTCTASGVGSGAVCWHCLHVAMGTQPCQPPEEELAPSLLARLLHATAVADFFS